MKQNLKEVQSHVDIDKLADNPLTAFLKEYFEKNNLELLPSETQGDQYTVALMTDLETEQENLQFKRGEAKQLVYDIKYKLEQAIQDANFRVTALSIFSVDVKNIENKDKIIFAFTFMYTNVGNQKVSYESVEFKKTFLDITKERLIKELEEKTGKKVILEKYSKIQKRAAEKILNNKDISYVLSLMTKTFSRKNDSDAFANFERLHKNILNRLIIAANNIMPEETYNYPLGSYDSYKQLASELFVVTTDETIEEDNNNSNVININERY